jgi:tetrahydromethanopterin S-methyltransferase subunit B
VKLLGRIGGTAAASAVAALLGPVLWPVVLGLVVLGLVALIIVARAAFIKSSTPMRRLRAFVRDIRGAR